MKRILQLLIFILFSHTSFAGVTVTWNGGNGLWNTASNWDTGTVPGPGDHVVIPSGSLVKTNFTMTHTIQSLELDDACTLNIRWNSTLEIKDITLGYPLINWGTINVYGTLDMYDCNSGDSAMNYNDIVVHPSGHLHTWNINNVCLYNGPNGKFYNHGEVDLKSGYLGLENDGEFMNYGTMKISESTSDGIENNEDAISKNYGHLEVFDCSVNGIVNHGVFSNTTTGLLDIYDIPGWGIENEIIGSANNHFLNLGSLEIHDIGGIGIHNNGGKVTNYRVGNMEISSFEISGINQISNATFVNRGFLDISDDIGTGIINNESTVRNFIFGDILIAGRTGISSFGAGAFFDNYGEIDIENGIWGLSLGEDFINRFSGNITINSYSYGIESYSGIFTNKGTIDIMNCDSRGYSVRSAFINEKNLNISGSSVAIDVQTLGSVQNTGNIILTSNSTDIEMYANFDNLECGTVELHNPITLNSAGAFNNNGHIQAYETADYNNNGGTFENDGLVSDLSATYNPYITNNSLLLEPYLGTLQVGAISSDVFEIASSAFVTILGIYTDEPLNTSAGNYDQVANEFTPVNASVGVSEFYVEWQESATGCTHVSHWTSINAVDPFKKNNVVNRTQVNEDSFDVGPNPSRGRSKITLHLNSPKACTIEIVDAMGRVVDRKYIDNNENQEFWMEQINSGVYIIRLLINDEIVQAKKWIKI